jgi:large subunit ribosomal protein L31e
VAKETKDELKANEEQEELEDMADEKKPEDEEQAEETLVQAEEKEEAAPEEKEEAKPKRKEKKEEEIVEERFYIIPLQKALVRPPKKRAPRAMQLVKEFVNKHMKVEMKVSEEEEEEELPQLIIDTGVNEKVWSRGIEKPPRKIKVRATKDKDGNVTVYLAENP